MFLRLPITTLVAGLLGATAALAGPIKIEGAWARPAPAGLPTSAAYLVIRNTGRTPATLEAVATPAARASVHQSMDHGGMMSMQPMGPLMIPAGGSVTLKPGGLHIMLEDLKRPLTVGERLPLTLRFKSAGAVHVDAAVRPTAP